jgi:hypothetical protein
MNNLLTAWWLALGFAFLAVVAAWPILLGPMGARGEVPTLGWLMLAAAGGVLLVVGVLVANGLAKGQRSTLNLFKQLTPIAMGVGLLAIVGVVVVLFVGQEPALGPTPLLSGVLLLLTAALPFFFGGLALSIANRDEVRAYIQAHEPVEAEVERPAEPEEELVVEAAAEEEPGAAVTEVDVGPQATTAAGPKRADEDRNLAALEAALLAKQSAAATTPTELMRDTAGATTGPDALDAIFAEETMHRETRPVPAAPEESTSVDDDEEDVLRAAFLEETFIQKKTKSPADQQGPAAAPAEEDENPFEAVAGEEVGSHHDAKDLEAMDAIEVMESELAAAAEAEEHTRKTTPDEPGRTDKATMIAADEPVIIEIADEVDPRTGEVKRRRDGAS